MSCCITSTVSVSSDPFVPIDVTTRFDLSDLSSNITLSTCGYSIEKFHACLSREAKEGNGKHGGMCYSYVDGLVDKCKKEAKYE